MATVLILLAVLFAVAGGLLWYFANVQDQRRNPQQAGESTADPAGTAADAPGDSREEEFSDPFADELTEDIPVAPEPESPEPEYETVDSEPADAEPEDVEPADESVADANELESEAEYEAEPASDVESAPKLKSHFTFGIRRERKAWAERHGWDFRKTDSYLVDEWSRGAAATGAAPRDIAVGEAYGHETLLMDIGGVNVMAMRTGALAAVVVDMRRRGIAHADAAPQSEDLFEVATIGDFDVLATDTGATERMLDERVDTALSAMPDGVVAAWMENDWVLAQTRKDARQDVWDAMLVPLALLADAARVLPPREPLPLRVADNDPSRDIPEPEPVGAQLSVVGDGPVDEFAHPPVQRPVTPLTLPSRKRGEALGAVEKRPLGVDEVGAIADGEETPSPHLPRSLEVDPQLAAERARLDRQLGRAPKNS